MSNPDWTDPLDYSVDDLLARNEQVERLANMLIDALEAGETYIRNKCLGDDHAAFRAGMQSVIHDARQVLA